ncbi:MAG: GNAT family N-acetyltransferase [Cyanobacteria bacterium P01_D01_bin.156]
MSLVFRPIDLQAHAELCIHFRRDAFMCSFTDGDKRFALESGERAQGYIKWLNTRINACPESCVHVFDGQEIIGQIETELRGQEKLGYVYLFYVIPSRRGQGFSDQLHAYVMQLFQDVGVIRAQLSVSASNQAAINFYKRHAWEDVGPKAGNIDVHLMERAIEVLELVE